MNMNVIYEYDLLAVHSPVEGFAQHVMIMKGCRTKDITSSCKTAAVQLWTSSIICDICGPEPILYVA